jgi:hypothetical protein
MNASVRIMNPLRFSTDRFRVLAPAAGERTPLHEDGGPDTRTVVKSKVMDIEYQRERLLHQIAPEAII